MKILVVVDANIIMSALLGGKPSIILFDGRFKFVTCEFVLTEIQKYLPRLQEKTGLPEEEILNLLDSLPLQIYRRAFYEDKLKQANNLMAEIDKKDIDVLALALKLESYLWSQDKHFEKSEYPKILKTHNLL